MLKFLVFSDLHYKKGMYIASVDDLRAIFRRAAEAGVDFVIHGGDLCNDYLGSPELVREFLENPYGLPVYGVYGNHELESEGNTVDVVTPLLSNREVFFPSPDVGYWYTDIKGYRIIGLDTNYSFNRETEEWEHNRPASWGPPKGNEAGNSLSPMQLSWLDGVLRDAEACGKKVLVFSHDGMSGIWRSSPDAPAVRELFEKYRGTVLMSVNGHWHADDFAVRDGVVYMNVNTVRNGYWCVTDEFHYDDSHTFLFTDYDADGNPTDTREIPINTLWQAKNTWFFKDPLSALVTLSDDGTVTVEGSQSEWMYGIVPPGTEAERHPAIFDRTAKAE